MSSVTSAPATVFEARDAAPSAAYAWFVVLAIALLQIGSYIDRQIINLLVEPMRRDFAISDTQVSLLLGFAFALFYGVSAVPLGKLADRVNRVRVITVSVVFWSLATLGCMVAESYGALFVARMFVGLGEAALIPAGFSILSDYFRPGRLAFATSCVTGASFLGSGLALAFGGLVIGTLPQSPTVALPIAGEVRSWQLAFGFASIPSIIFLVLFLFVREPNRRGQGADGEKASLRAVTEFLASDKTLWIALFVGMALVNAFQYGLTAWIPTFFIRTYGWSPAEIGQLYGASFVVCGLLGTLSGGWLCDRLFDRYGRRAFILTPLASALISIPLIPVFALSNSALASAVLLIPLTYFGTLSFGAAIAALPSLAPNRMRAQLVAAYMLVGTIVGQGGGPWIIAVFTDFVVGEPALIRYSIAAVSTAVLAAGAAVLAIGLRRLSLPHRADAGATD